LIPQYLSISLEAEGRKREAKAARQKALALDISPSEQPLESYSAALQGAAKAGLIRWRSGLTAALEIAIGNTVS